MEASLQIRLSLLTAALSLALTACPDDDPGEPCAPAGPVAMVHVHVAGDVGVFGAPGAAPTWIAYQNGTCPWKQVTDETGNGDYELPVTSLAYGVAVECADPDLVDDETPPRLNVELLTIAETTDVAFRCAHLQGGLEAHALGARFGETHDKVLRLRLRDDATLWQIVGDGAGTVGEGWMVAGGAYDLAVEIGDKGPLDDDMEDVPTGLKILREQTADTEDNYLPIDVADPDFVPYGQADEVSGERPSDTTSTFLRASYLTRWGTAIPLGEAGFYDGQAPAVSYRTIPAAVTAVGDAYSLHYAGYDHDGHDRMVSRFTTALAPAPLVLPPLLGRHTLTIENHKAVWRFDRVPGARLYGLVQRADAFTRPNAIVEVSAGRLPADGPAEIELPDFEDVPGFSYTWGFRDDAGADARLEATAFGNDGGWPAAAIFDSIGENPGAPADLDGLSFWTTSGKVTRVAR